MNESTSDPLTGKSPGESVAGIPTLPSAVAPPRKGLQTEWILIAVIAFAALFVGYSTGTLRVPAPVISNQSAVTPQDGRLDKVELQHAFLKDALERSIKQYENLLTYFAVIVSLMVGFQAYLAQRQSNREGDRHQTQDIIERHGVERVSKILDVLHKTLNVRLTTEEQIEAFRQNSVRINEFLETQQAVIKKQRAALEKNAISLSSVRRQMFRTVVADLDTFARSYDTFQQQYADLEEHKEARRAFSARVEYIRGVSAHFSNQPQVAAEHLGKVTARDKREEDETIDDPFKKRKASAYYYIGLNLANINEPSAIDEFESAIKTYPDRTDFLSRIVLAEAYAVQRRFPDAQHILGPEITEWELEKKRDADEVELGLCKKSVATGDPVYRRLRSRVTLIRANMLLQQRGTAGLGDAIRLLMPIWGSDSDDEKDPLCRKDQSYYYAVSTLGQLIKSVDGAQASSQYFDHALQKIIESYDLRTIVEVRSRILVRLVAAMCAVNGSKEQSRATNYLTEATGQIELLPKMNGKSCSVFSPLSRTNEPPETITTHIEAIRNGDVILLASSAAA
jgi:hypothetical protein